MNRCSAGSTPRLVDSFKAHETQATLPGRRGSCSGRSLRRASGRCRLASPWWASALQLFPTYRLDHFAVGQHHGVHARPFGRQLNQPKPAGVGLKING